MWYWILNIVMALWVFFDARSRKMDRNQSILWGIGTLLIMILVIPFYFAKRTLKFGEVREGGTAWNAIKAFAIFWTLMMFVAGIAGMIATGSIVSNSSSGAEQAGAAIGTAIGMGLIIGLWFAVLVGALVVGLFVKKSSIVEKGQLTDAPITAPQSFTTTLTTPMKCYKCGFDLPATAKFCRSCGELQNQTESPSSNIQATTSIPQASPSQPAIPPIVSAPRSKAVTYAVAGVLVFAVVGGGGYWGWTQKVAAEERATLVAKQLAEEQKRKAEEEQQQKIKEAEEKGRREAEAIAKQEEEHRMEAEKAANQEAEQRQVQQEEAHRRKAEKTASQEAEQRQAQQEAQQRVPQRQANPLDDALRGLLRDIQRR